MTDMARESFVVTGTSGTRPRDQGQGLQAQEEQEEEGKRLLLDASMLPEAAARLFSWSL